MIELTRHSIMVTSAECHVISRFLEQCQIPFVGNQMVHHIGFFMTAVASRIGRYKISRELPPGGVSSVEGLSFVPLRIELSSPDVAFVSWLINFDAHSSTFAKYSCLIVSPISP